LLQLSAPTPFIFTNRSNVAATGLYRKLGGVAKNGDDLLIVFPMSGHVD